MQETRAVMIEAVVLAAIGLAFSFTVNALSPRGLRLTRNYFPNAERSTIVTGTHSPNPGANTSFPSNHALEVTWRRLQQKGLQLVSSNEVIELFHDPRHQQGLVAFIDARDERNYQTGHVPAAWQFDHYRAEQYLPVVLPVCLAAEKVIVYCSGGSCEDSEFAAALLRDAGVPAANLYVYPGGISEWMTNDLPVETGARGSGGTLKPKP